MKTFEYPEDNEVSLMELKAVYYQNGDSNDADNAQELTIRTEDAGGGAYFIIETQRWACDNFDELIKIFEDFKSRVK